MLPKHKREQTHRRIHKDRLPKLEKIKKEMGFDTITQTMNYCVDFTEEAVKNGVIVSVDN